MLDEERGPRPTVLGLLLAGCSLLPPPCLHPGPAPDTHPTPKSARSPAASLSGAAPGLGSPGPLATGTCRSDCPRRPRTSHCAGGVGGGTCLCFYILAVLLKAWHVVAALCVSGQRTEVREQPTRNLNLVSVSAQPLRNTCFPSILPSLDEGGTSAPRNCWQFGGKPPTYAGGS